MTEIISSLLSSRPVVTNGDTEEPSHSFLYEEFGLSLYPSTLPLPYMGNKDEFTNDPSSLFLAEGNWCSSFTDFGLFPNSFENEFLSDTPTSSFPSTPISCSESDPLSPDDQQEINDIVSSFQTPFPSSPITQPFTDPSVMSPVSPITFLPPSPPPPLRKRSRRPSSRSSSSKRTTPTATPTSSKASRKKEQNKTAAVRYRQKKRTQLDLLLIRENELEKSNKQLQEQVEYLTTEIDYMKSIWADVCKAKTS